MEQLTPDQEMRMKEFTTFLGTVIGPEDLFPPDEEEGVREPSPPFSPSPLEAEEALCLL